MVRPPLLGKLLLPGATWRQKASNNQIYLTFDDGPIPKVTPWVLDEADKWNVKFTFFCVGENVQKHPDIFHEITQRGHQVGNHTYNHLKAWKSNKEQYFSNIEKANKQIQSKLFRPPHGQLYPWYIKRLKKSFDRIVMWDILTKDYDKKLSGQQVFENVQRNIRPGTIIVFHDSLKAERNMKYALPKTLELIGEKGYTAKTIK